MDRFKNALMKDEGFRAQVYNDHKGIPTIGYGTKISEIVVSKEVAEAWLDAELDEKEERLRKIPEYCTLSIARKNVIRSMAYQMGVRGVIKFKKMWCYIRVKAWEMAAIEMRDSRWWSDPATRSRAERMAERMGTGEW